MADRGLGRDRDAASPASRMMLRLMSSVSCWPAMRMPAPPISKSVLPMICASVSASGRMFGARKMPSSLRPGPAEISQSWILVVRREGEAGAACGDGAGLDREARGGSSAQLMRAPVSPDRKSVLEKSGGFFCRVLRQGGGGPVGLGQKSSASPSGERSVHRARLRACIAQHGPVAL
jgi:hypothetical protein